MRRTLVPGLVALLLALLLPHARVDARGDPLTKKADRQKEKIAKVWFDLARYLVGRDRKTEAQDALAKGMAIEPVGKAPANLVNDVEGLVGEGSLDGSTEARIEKAR